MVLDTRMGSPFMAETEFLEEPLGSNSKLSDKDNSSCSLGRGHGCVEDADVDPKLNKSIPKLTIAILVVGTRGDVQPFLPLAKRLQEVGHRVRLATHIHFRDFVKSAGLEFFPLGGDPKILAMCMVKSRRLSLSLLEVQSTMPNQYKAVIESLFPACTEPDIETGRAFRAQAIISNPSAWGQAHVAEALRVPLHVFFIMPYTPTSEFPQPFALVPKCTSNLLSYKVFNMMMWWDTRSYINDLRKEKLKLAPIPFFSVYDSSLSRFPSTYMWSSHVLPKPKDWGPLVDVVGYCFLNLGSKYQPREGFVEWLQEGPKPIYIGFGSMPLENPEETTRIVMEALKETGQRGILDHGWGELGILSDVPKNIFLLENCPHDWLFPHCYALVHHGGPGTIGIGLKAGCPTTVVPFAGDQFLWGAKIYERGLGPEPIPIEQLSVEALSNAITFMLQPEVKSRAMEIAKLIENEDGVSAAVDAFHRHLPSELPLPAPLSSKDDDRDSLHWFFNYQNLALVLACILIAFILLPYASA